MAIGTALSRVLGLIREQLMAFYFGAGWTVDAFQVAFRIPNLMREVFAEGAFSQAVISTLSEIKSEQAQKEQIFRLYGLCFTFLFAVTGLLALAGYIFRKNIILLLAPSF